MYQRRPPNLVASTADLSERDIKENPVVKEEETNDTEVFEEVVVEVARLSKEPKSSISPPPGSSMPPPVHFRTAGFSHRESALPDPLNY